LPWDDLRSSLRLIGEMLHRGGLVVLISDGASGGRSIGRLMLQPDADAVLKIDAADMSDPALPGRIHAAVQALAAELDNAQNRLDGARRAAMLLIALLFTASTVATTLNLRSLAWQIGTAAAFTLAALVLRWLFGAAVRMLVQRAMREVT
jgi:hypothetical protein